MSALWAWRICFAFASAASFWSTAVAQSGVSARTGIDGSYQLESVREVGAELRLGADGRFEFGMAYGGADRSAQGRWTASGGFVTLTTDPPPVAGFKLNPSSASVPDDYDKDPSKSTVLVVQVKTPRLGLVWSNMAISAEFSNGQSRSGVTGSNGMLGFLARPEPEWKGAYVQRISVAYPKERIDAASFRVDSRATRAIAIDFEPGHLAPPAFKRATFNARGDSAKRLLVQQSQEGPGEAGWVFVRR